MYKTFWPDVYLIGHQRLDGPYSFREAAGSIKIIAVALLYVEF